MKRNYWYLMLIIIAALVSGCIINEECDPDPILPALADDGNEPPVFPYLADSPWPMTHRTPYCQASSPHPGPEAAPLCFNYLDDAALPITLVISNAYPDGRRVVWGNSLTKVFKANPDNSIISFLATSPNPDAPGSIADVDQEKSISGAYTLMDSDGTFFVPRLKEILAFGDQVEDDPDSAIVINSSFQIPEIQLHGENDYIIGLSLTNDGMLAFVTKWGTVGVVSRDFTTAHYLYLGADEEISNSIACDENNKIYVVTSEWMYGIQWTGSALSLNENDGGWTAGYETGEDASGIRLGDGSGATPSLMGTGSQDKFVVITDGQDLMHLVLFWRDEIPADWVQIPGTKDRRIAAQVPVTFGNPAATASLSEQSVCVRGYGALVVNNKMSQDFGSRPINVLMSGNAKYAPYGAEKFEWDPGTRVLATAWVNEGISLPNGIPSMSSTTNLIYDIGQRGSSWTMEALDWDTGASVFHHVMGANLEFNSAYAATEIGHNGGLYSGTTMGMVRLMP